MYIAKRNDSKYCADQKIGNGDLDEIIEASKNSKFASVWTGDPQAYTKKGLFTPMSLFSASSITKEMWQQAKIKDFLEGML